MGRRVCSLPKQDYESPAVYDHPYLRIIMNGKQVVNPKTGAACVIPADEAPKGLFDTLTKGMELRPCTLTDNQINKMFVVGVDEPWK